MAGAVGSAGGAVLGGDDGSVGRYRWHRPEQTLLYEVVSQHPAFVEQMEAEDRPLPRFVRREFEGSGESG